MQYSIGIDIGSTSTKTVVLDEQKAVIDAFSMPTGWSSVDTAETVKKKLEEKGFFSSKPFIVATGYGRISVPYADQKLTEITCHAKGATHLFHTGTLTLIDIGGQDTKIISISDGQIVDFLMNDKCSAGTGRFLEVMANRLGLRPEELCTLARSGGGISISSLCTVFAESEVISLVGRGEDKANIAFAVVDSIVKKVASQAKRLADGSEIFCLTGGLSRIPAFAEALGIELQQTIQIDELGLYAGAFGAALLAAERRNA
ncbi:MAG TPA: acyl-CoA dehydratase activase [Methanocorpusculum sp.]|nr:acyl-CoA dehydratase activase [Methanocorpusculum sp.]